MRSVNYYKAFGILALGASTAFAAAQNQGSHDAQPPKHQQAPPQGGYRPSVNHAGTNGGYRSPGNHTGQDGYHLQRGTAAMQHGRMGQGGYTPGRHSTVVSQTPHGMRTEQRFAAGGRIVEATRSAPGGGTMHAVRYGNGVSGVVEHPIKPGYVSRTYVRGGRVVDARIYSQHSFTRFGRTFTYQSSVPAVAFAPAYYAWAVRPWSTGVAYQWGWKKEPWYAAYGDYFTPYSDYTSLDLWLTDYLIAQNMRASYQNWQADTYPDADPAEGEAAAPGGSAPGGSAPGGSAPGGSAPGGSAPDGAASGGAASGGAAAGGTTLGGARSGGPASGGSAPASSGAASPSSEGSGSHFDGGSTAPSPSDSTDSSAPTPPPEAAPPPITPEIKQALNEQIKLQLRERQKTADTGAAADGPGALRPGHKLFRVNAPLDVPSDTPGRVCSLGPDDYIERTGEMDNNGNVPVEVKLSGISDCGTGLVTRVSENDLEAMDSDQQEQLTRGMLAASKSMGPKGLPRAPAATPLLIAAGQARADVSAPNTLNQL